MRTNTKMTAIVCHGPEDYRVEEATRPTPGPGEMVIRVGACGICASDCKCWQGAKMFWGGADPVGQGAGGAGARVLRLRR